MANVINATTGGLVSTGDTTATLNIQTGSTTAIAIDASQAVTITNSVTSTNGTFTDTYGKVRAIPQSGSDKTTSYSLATTDVGRFVGVGTSGSITVPNSTFSAGDVVSIFNNTTGNVTLTMSITTAYIAGTNTDKDTLTLATRGVATILFISGTVCVVSGNVS
jgi:hypothetical protein